MEPRPLGPLVDQCESWGSVDWWRLEIRSFDRSPRVQRQLAQLGPGEAWRDEAARPSLGGCLLSLVFAASIVAPTIVTVVLGGWWRAGDDGAGPPLVFVGLLMSLSVAVVVHSEVARFRRPIAVDRRLGLRLALAHVVPDVIVLWLLVAAVRSDRYESARDPSLWWAAPVAVDLALHVWRVAADSVWRRGPQLPIEGLDGAVRDLDAATGSRILADRNAAIARLRDRGAIDENAAATAAATALGRLAMTMAPELGPAGVRSVQGDVVNPGR